MSMEASLLFEEHVLPRHSIQMIRKFDAIRWPAASLQMAIYGAVSKSAFEKGMKTALCSHV